MVPGASPHRVRARRGVPRSGAHPHHGVMPVESTAANVSSLSASHDGIIEKTEKRGADSFFSDPIAGLRAGAARTDDSQNKSIRPFFAPREHPCNTEKQEKTTCLRFSIARKHWNNFFIASRRRPSLCRQPRYGGALNSDLTQRSLKSRDVWSRSPISTAGKKDSVRSVTLWWLPTQEIPGWAAT